MSTEPPILALSGGPDSVYLLHHLLKQGTRPILAHFNHQLRGTDSDRDEQFVRELANQHQLLLEIDTHDVASYARPHKLSIETAARHLRYEFLERVRLKHHSDHILTAHHLDDNLETVLMNRLRGAHLRGEIGMREQNGAIHRPLLNITKKEILAYLHQHNIPYCHDATNQDTQFHRNWIRHILIPELLKKNPSLLHDFQKDRHIALATYQKYSDWAEQWLSQNPLSSTTFASLETHQQQFLLQHLYNKEHGSTHGLTTSHLNDVLTWILNGRTGTHKKFGQKITLINEYGEISLNTPPPQLPSSLSITTLKKGVEKNPNALHLDAEKIDPNKLSLRFWQPGDRFQPSGMTGTKKLQDYFTDAKIPRHKRQHIPIITTSEDQIVAVGLRPDEKFRATPSSKNVLSVSFKTE